MGARILHKVQKGLGLTAGNLASEAMDKSLLILSIMDRILLLCVFQFDNKPIYSLLVEWFGVLCTALLLLFFL